MIFERNMMNNLLVYYFSIIKHTYINKYFRGDFYYAKIAKEL